MDFSLSDQQKLLRESVSRFVADECDFHKLRLQPPTNGLRPDHWQTFAELGWLGLMIPEEDGGLGGSLEDASVVFEELGKGLVDSPLLSTAVLAVHVVTESEGFERRAALLEDIMAGRQRVALAIEEANSRYDLALASATAETNGSGKFRLRGRKIAVLDGASADSFLVSVRMPLDGGKVGIGILLLPADTRGLELRRYRLIDGRHAADLGLDGVEVPRDHLVVPPEQGLEVLRDTVNRASILIAAEALGAMDAAVALTATYLETRQQFRRPLSAFQVLTHRLSDMFIQAENARSMVLRGLSAMNGPAKERDAAISATMVAVIKAGEFVGSNAIQLHGGVGMADENVIGHYYKRLRSIGKSYGDLHFHMERYMRTLRK